MRQVDHSPLLGSPVAPPRSWFEKPDGLREDGFLTVLESGRCFGRFYSRGVPLLRDDNTKQVPTPSPTGYRLFHRGSVVCDDGTDLDVGVITVEEHGPSNFDDPQNVVATVRAGDDAAGGWFAGSLVPEATVADGAQVRRCQLSGEWVPMSDAWFASHNVEPDIGLELSGLCVCVTGRAVLHTTYRGWPATVHRLSVDQVEQRVAAYLDAIREVIDENPPVAAVAALRRILDDADERHRLELVARVQALPEVVLPREHVAQPVKSSTRRTT